MEEQGREGKFLEAEDLHYMNLELEKQRRRALEAEVVFVKGIGHNARVQMHKSHICCEELRMQLLDRDRADILPKIKAKRKAHQQRVKELAEKYRLESSWGYDPDTGLIITE